MQIAFFLDKQAENVSLWKAWQRLLAHGIEGTMPHQLVSFAPSESIPFSLAGILGNNRAGKSFSMEGAILN